jgi:hypothetical protein
MSSESDRVLAQGIPIKLEDREVHLKFGMRGLKMLEDEFGSIEGIERVLIPEVDSNGKRVETKYISHLAFVLSAGLAHEGLTLDDVLDRAVPALLPEYSEAIAKAIDQAFPARKGGKPSGKARASKPSPGATGTTPPPSSSDEPTSSSGE